MPKTEVKQSPKDRLKDITDSIETGIKEMFESAKYQSYLRTMSRFHKYSFNNQILISIQNPNATLVAGYNKWKDQFSRNVKKGEKAIKIIAPTPFKIKEEREKLDPVTMAPLLDSNGKIELEEVERQIPMFRVVSVFDVSQTDGKEIPSLVSSLDGSVEQYEIFIEALKRTSTAPIKFAALSQDIDGYYHLQDKDITIREEMSEVQTISAIIHEIAHSRLHDYELQSLEHQEQNAQPIEKKDRNTEEVEAESISFAVCSYYGIETGANSFGYIANWSKNKELNELKASLETIGTTSSALISSLDKHFTEITQEKEMEVSPTMTKAEELATKIDAYLSSIHNYEYQDTASSKEEHISEIMSYLENGNTNAIKEYISVQISENHLDTNAIELMNDIHSYEFMNYPKELAYKIDDKYFAIQDCNEGFDYSFFDIEFNLLDGGVYDDIEINIYQAIHELLEPEKGFSLWKAEDIIQVNYNELMENVDNVEMAKIESAKTEFTNQNHLINEIFNYPMPDINLSREDILSFGYTTEELLPLTKERAYELFQEDLTIYLLYPDNTEAMVFGIEELDSHAGYFGIEKTDWENFYEYNAMNHHSNDDKYAIIGNVTKVLAISTENPLKNTELQIEQNFNMIDGIINNEDNAKESVLEDLKATHAQHKKQKTEQKKTIEMER